MALSELRRKLEFLALFCSLPDRHFYEEVYGGQTPAGELHPATNVSEFCDDMMTAATELFVNSPHQRPLFPLASEYIADQIEASDFSARLVEQYRFNGKVAEGYPPDHLKVLYEYLLLKMTEQDTKGAREFHNAYIRGWTNRYADNILKRNPPELFVRIAHLIEDINRNVEEL